MIAFTGSVGGAFACPKYRQNDRIDIEKVP